MAGAAESLTLSDLASWAQQAGRNLTGMSFRQPLQVCAVLVRSDVLSNFQGSHDPLGNPWPPLRRPRANSKGGDKPLLDTGILQASVTGRGQGHVEEITDTQLIVGTNLDYAAIHQYGGTVDVPEKKRQKPWVWMGPDGPVFTRKIKAHQVQIPQRQFLGFSEKVTGEIQQVFAEFMGEQVK